MKALGRENIDEVIKLSEDYKVTSKLQSTPLHTSVPNS